MESGSRDKGKTTTTNKFFEPPPCGFNHLKLEHKKIPPYANDIWVPSLSIEENRYAKIFIPSMECCFRLGDRLVTVENDGVTTRMLNWSLETDQIRTLKWIAKSEDHIDFYVYL